MAMDFEATMTGHAKFHLRHTKTIAVVSDIVMPTVRSEYLIGIAKYAQKRRNFTIRSIDIANVKMEDPIDGCDGIILDTDEADVIERAKNSGLPVVDTTCATSSPLPTRSQAASSAPKFFQPTWLTKSLDVDFSFSG